MDTRLGRQPLATLVGEVRVEVAVIEAHRSASRIVATRDDEATLDGEAGYPTAGVVREPRRRATVGAHIGHRRHATICVVGEFARRPGNKSRAHTWPCVTRGHAAAMNEVSCAAGIGAEIDRPGAPHAATTSQRFNSAGARRRCRGRSGPWAAGSPARAPAWPARRRGRPRARRRSSTCSGDRAAP
jgi:hypothetical protein